ncbi:MAG: phage portal protein [Alphaproteobacteria bacterium]|nr:phage portal protein [Alphaproteobacteria bacterium]
MDHFNSAILASAGTISRRADYYAHNNPHAKSGVAAIVANTVGTGIKPQSQHPSEKFRETVHRQWLTWTDRADADGLTDFYGFQALVTKTMVVHGEAFVRLLVRPVSGKPTPQLQLIHPDQVDRALSRDLGAGRRIVGGIEFDADNRRLAYHVFKQRPGDPFATSFETIRVPAADMVHVFDPVAPGQVRGVSWLSAVLLRLHEIDGLEDAQLMRQRIAAMFAGFITDLEGGAGGFDGTQTGSVLESGLEPGTLKVLPPGTDIKFSDPAEVGDTAEFLKSQLRAVAAGLGVTYEQLTGDLSGVNYSSIRAGLVEFRRRIEALQHHVLVFQFCRPVWERFVRMQVLSGALQAPGFERDESPYLAVKWIAPGWEWVDPLKDAQAAIAEIEAGIRSRAEVVNGRGYDVEALDAEIAADKARAERLGLKFGASAKPGGENA